MSARNTLFRFWGPLVVQTAHSALESTMDMARLNGIASRWHGARQCMVYNDRAGVLGWSDNAAMGSDAIECTTN
ncbi:hypothetical protein ACEN88_36190, partial [Massilia sp. CT11-108]